MPVYDTTVSQPGVCRAGLKVTILFGPLSGHQARICGFDGLTHILHLLCSCHPSAVDVEEPLQHLSCWGKRQHNTRAAGGAEGAW